MHYFTKYGFGEVYFFAEDTIDVDGVEERLNRAGSNSRPSSPAVSRKVMRTV